MKAEISYTGCLTIIAENSTELYSVKKWAEDSVNYSEVGDMINIDLGSFDIADNFIEPEFAETSLLDHVMEMKEL